MLRDLRLSMTDRCNLRCAYCMPEDHYRWLPREDLLSVGELAALVAAFTDVGVRKLRLTGGEPLLRRDLPDLVGRLSSMPALADVALTTNGTLLRGAARPLRDAGLHRVTVSLDTLRSDRHRLLTKRDDHLAVVAGIDDAVEVGLATKINTVVLRGANDDELADLLRFASSRGSELRFIEYMDVGGATRWDPRQVVPADEVLARIEASFGPVVPAAARTSAPARRYATSDGLTFGIVASTTAPFCAECDRSRVTADGRWFHCLYAPEGTDLRHVLRSSGGRDRLASVIAAGWRRRDDRGAVDRLQLGDSRMATPVEVLRRDPHQEMHIRGG